MGSWQHIGPQDCRSGEPIPLALLVHIQSIPTLKNVMENGNTVSTRPVLLTKQQVSELLNVCERTIEMAVKAGKFPPAVKIGRCAMWDERAILAYVAAKFEAQLAWTGKQPKGRQPKAEKQGAQK